MMDPFFIDGTKITLGAGTEGSDGYYSNWTSGSSHGDIWTYLGKDTQAACARLISEWPTGWTTAHRLRGIPYVFLRADSAEDATHFSEAFGEPTFLITG